MKGKPCRAHWSVGWEPFKRGRRLPPIHLVRIDRRGSYSMAELPLSQARALLKTLSQAIRQTTKAKRKERRAVHLSV